MLLDLIACMQGSSDCLTTGEFGKRISEGADVDSSQDLEDFFRELADKQHEHAKARLEDALKRIEEVTQEAEVMSHNCFVNHWLFMASFKHILCYANSLGGTGTYKPEAA